MTADRAELATRLRLATGLVLMTFLTTHLLNHALGIHSLAAMERGRELFVAVWRSLPGLVLLYAALAGHVLLVVHKLYRRRSLRLPAWEKAQLGRAAKDEQLAPSPGARRTLLAFGRRRPDPRARSFSAVSVMPALARNGGPPARDRATALLLLERLRHLGDDRVVDVLLGLERLVGGAVLEVELHDLPEQLVQRIRLAGRAHQLERLLKVGVVDVLKHLLELLGREGRSGRP